MKNFLVLLLLTFVIASCASVESIKKSPNCIVWRDQEYIGAYSIDVVTKKVEWKGACKSYNRDCQEVMISLDENNNVLSGTNVLGKVENNELKFVEKHALTDFLNFTGVRVYPDQKLVKSSAVTNNVTTEDSYSYNDKCSAEEAVTGAVALSLISKAQSRSK